MKLHIGRMLLLIALGTVLVAWPGLLVLLTTCTADTDWCPDGGNAAPQGSSPDPKRSEPGDPPPCPPP